MKRFRLEVGRPPRSQEEILERVYAKGFRLRLRRQLLQAGSIGVVLLLATSAAYIATDNTQVRGIKIVDPAPDHDPTVGPTEEPNEMPTEPQSPEPMPDEPEPSPTSTLVCHNTTDFGECGPVVWIPEPGPNAPLEVDIYVTPAHPVVGEAVTVKVVVSDDDSPVTAERIDIRFPGEGMVIADCFGMGPHGPWDTPPRQSGAAEKVETHTFDEPGNFEIHIRASSKGDGFGGGCPPTSPYGSRFSETRTIAVTGAVSPSPTPTASATDTPSPTPTPS